MLLSPKQIARAINVSESSVKRWCDEGKLRSERTAGGHRRIHISDVLTFIRDSKHRLAQPQILGLPVSSGPTQRSLQRAALEFRHSLVAGRVETCREVILDLFVANHSIASIADQVIVKAFEALGEDWACGTVQIYEERRACQITQRILFELQTLIPSPPIDAPFALGGTLEEDHYTIPTLLVELVLTQTGLRVIQLGSGLPVKTMQAAIHHHQPLFVWVSVSHFGSEAVLVSDMAQLQSSVGPDQTLIVGGRALHPAILQRFPNLLYLEHLSQLHEYVTSCMHRTLSTG